MTPSLLLDRASCPTVRSVGCSLPPYHVDQDTLTAALRGQWMNEHFNAERLDELHRAAQVGGRFLALPLDAYPALDSFAQCNEAWVRVATDIGERAVRDALHRAELDAADVGHLLFVTTTGLATPSIDAHLVNRLRLRQDIKRVPIFGLGCVGGAAGLARASELLRAFPNGVAVLLSVELCSLTLQRDDLSVANIIATGIFGDGASAVVLEGAKRDSTGPHILATRSVFYPDTEKMMGWDIVNTGFKLILSAKIPDMVRAHLRSDVDRFLAAHGLDRSRIRHWIAHTGGPKVLQAFEAALELPPKALERSWRSLREVGNLSSASVLFVLADFLESGEARSGDLGLLLAMGPGFCSEMVLLQW